MKSRRFYGSSLIVLLAALGIVIYLAGGSPGDAGFWRNRNFYPAELARTMNSDLIRLRNYESFELKNTMNADVIKLRNYEAFELKRTMNADVIKLRNFQAFEMAQPINETEISISSIETAFQGVPQSVFVRGDIVEIYFNVTNTGDPSLYDGLISVEIFSPSGEVIFLTYLFDDVLHGMTEEYLVGYRVPYFSDIGTYLVKAMVLTDWPSEGGIGLAIEEGTFDVS